MANTSLKTAFERFWQHVVAAVGNKADIDHTHPEATQSESGLMSVTDKVSLDALNSGKISDYHYATSYSDLEEYIDTVFNDMGNRTVRNIVILDIDGSVSGTTPFGQGYSVITLFKESDNYLMLKSGSVGLMDDSRTNEVVRKKIEGTWQEWEYVNPPMNAGVEYRTTKMYDGKPVYTKVMNLALSNTNSDALAVGILSPNMISYKVKAYNSSNEIIMNFPMVDNNNAVIAREFYQDGYFFIQTFADLTGYTATVQFWYTKD